MFITDLFFLSVSLPILLISPCCCRLHLFSSLLSSSTRALTFLYCYLRNIELRLLNMSNSGLEKQGL